jgi:hypothetical protein
MLRKTLFFGSYGGQILVSTTTTWSWVGLEGRALFLVEQQDVCYHTPRRIKQIRPTRVDRKGILFNSGSKFYFY